jgi:hypothetical protein
MNKAWLCLRESNGESMEMTRVLLLPVLGDTVECDRIAYKEKKKEFSHLESSSSQIIYQDLVFILFFIKFLEADSEEDLLLHATIAGIRQANMCRWEK